MLLIKPDSLAIEVSVCVREQKLIKQLVSPKRNIQPQSIVKKSNILYKSIIDDFC